MWNALINGMTSFFNFVHDTLIGSVITNKNISYGLAIIIFTLIIRMLLLPLNIKQTRSQIRMQEIQPELKKLQEKYKGDPQRSQQEVMKLYKEKGVNPLGGCLPLLLQWPILIAMYSIFTKLVNSGTITGIGFLGIIPDLSGRGVVSNPLTWILPILSVVTTYVSGALMTAQTSQPQTKQQGGMNPNTMNIGMSIFMGFMSWGFYAALVLYWVTNNLIQIGQTKLIRHIDSSKVNNEA